METNDKKTAEEILNKHWFTENKDTKQVSFECTLLAMEEYKNQFTPVSDGASNSLQGMREKYVNHFGGQVNCSGEDGDFTPKLLYEIFDYFAPFLSQPIELDNKKQVEDWDEVFKNYIDNERNTGSDHNLIDFLKANYSLPIVDIGETNSN